MAEQTKNIIVVGGGWAGLSCAVELSLVGHRVTLLESARQLGGRARRVAFGDEPVDNGQHLLIGAYRQTFSLLKRLNVPFDQLLQRNQLDLHAQYCSGEAFNLHLGHILVPLNLFIGLILAKGFTLRDKWHALSFGLRLFT